MAKAVDSGQAELEQIRRIESEAEPTRKLLASRQAELADLERRTAEQSDRLKLDRSALYDGTIKGAKEAIDLEKKIASLEQEIEALESRQMELLEEIPNIEKQLRPARRQIRDLKAAIQAKRALAQESLNRWKEEHAARLADRPRIAALVPADLLARYDSVRKRTGTPAMSVVQNESACVACGVVLPARTLDRLSQDALTACEQCHRILFLPVPLDV